LLRFAIDDADEVSAIIFGELYRRGDDWKFRAVGQGYASGLAGLATDFGVDVDDADTEDDAPTGGEPTSTPATEDTTVPGTAGADGRGVAPAASVPAGPGPVLEAVPAPRRPAD